MKFHISKNISRIMITAIAVITVIALVLLGVWIWDHHTKPSDNTDSYMSDDSEKPIVYVEGQPYTLKSDLKTILFLGVDRMESGTDLSHSNNQQVDTLLLLVIDDTLRRYSIIPINRDTIATYQMMGVTGESAGDITAQIALAHAYGTGEKDSVRNVIHAVSDLLYGVPVQQYFRIQMDAVPILNDKVGGVSLSLKDDFTHLDPSYTKGTEVVLHGDQALKYVQERGALEDSSNVSRMERQQQYLTAWKHAFMDLYEKDSVLLSSMLADVSDYMLTDLTAAQLDQLVTKLESYSTDGFISIEGESRIEDGYTAFHCDEKQLRQLIISMFYEPTQNG